MPSKPERGFDRLPLMPGRRINAPARVLATPPRAPSEVDCRFENV